MTTPKSSFTPGGNKKTTPPTEGTSKAKKTLIWTSVGMFLSGAILSAGVTFLALNPTEREGQNTLSNKGVVATLDGKDITASDLYDKMVIGGGKTALEGLIADRLTILEAEANKIKIGDEEVQTELDNLIAEYGSEEALDEALESYNQTKDELREDIVTYLKLVALLNDRIDTSDKALEAFYKENKEAFNQKEQVRASHILVKTEEEAKQVKAKLDKGEDWAKVAKEHSLDYKETNSDKDGSDLGYFGRDQMVEPFEKAAFSMKPGEISSPVATEHGYHIIKLVDKAEAKTFEFKDVKEQVKQAVQASAMETEFDAWYEESLAKYEYKNFLEAEQTARK